MGNLLDRILKGELGAKTVFAAVALVALVILQATGHISAVQFDQYAKVAEALGLIGLRDAVSRLPK